MDVPPDLRANIDVVIVLRDNIRANRERVYKYFAGVFPNFATFDETMQACTANYECMVLDQTSLSYKISDCVYFYKATPDLEYKVGAPEYWNFSSKKQLEDGDMDSDDSDPDSKNNRGSEVTVKKRYPTRPPPSDDYKGLYQGDYKSSEGYSKDYRSMRHNFKR